MTQPDDSPPPEPAPDPAASYVRRLLHRWLIQYNPLYLLSAALVLGGAFVLSRGLVQEDSRLGPLGVSAIADLYAACLVGGAALLVRIGQRRPAVMLALLTILYQWDLTLHTERSPAFGWWAAAAWGLAFAAKLHGLAWAMKIRLSRGATGALMLAGLGLAFVPLLLMRTGPQEAGALVAVWVFAIASLQRGGAVESLDALDGWGATVLRRAVRAAWVISTVLVAGHVLFWATQGNGLLLSLLLPVVPLLHLRTVRSEAKVWAIAVGTLVLVGLLMPAALSLTALLTAAALTLRALSPMIPPEHRVVAATARTRPPYRTPVAEADPDAPEVPEEPAFVETIEPARVEPDAIKRLLAGAVFAGYVSVWTLGWSGGAWPAHMLPLDLALTAIVLAAAWKARTRFAVPPLLVTYVHLLFQMGLLLAPQSLTQWGVSAIVLGFVLLIGSLATSYRLRAVLR